MDYQIRKLNTADIMPMVSVINKLDFKKVMNALDVSKLEAKEKAIANGVTAEMVNTDDNVALSFALDAILPVVGIILEDLPKCEKPLFSFLASMCGMDEKEFRELPPAAVPDVLFEVVHQEGFMDFFRAASRFLK